MTSISLGTGRIFEDGEEEIGSVVERCEGNLEESSPSRNSNEALEEFVQLESDEYLPLLKSTRLKHYFKLAILSALAVVSSYDSDLKNKALPLPQRKEDIIPDFMNLESNVLEADRDERIYCLVVSSVSLLYHLCIVMIHVIDGIFPLQKMRKAFNNGSYAEIFIIAMSTIWWFISTCINTSLKGVAGDGKGQYDLYFVHWICLFINIHMVEIWLVAANHESIYQSIQSWPNRAPGFIMIFICTLACMLSILDLRQYGTVFRGNPDNSLFVTLQSVANSQWEFFIIACVTSLAISIAFGLMEVFRKEDYYIHNIKSTMEFSLEGISLTILFFIWITATAVGTTDGVTSEVGNGYFLTWASTIAVIQTYVTWIKDWRRNVREVSMQQYKDYRRSQELVEPMSGVVGKTLLSNEEEKQEVEQENHSCTI